MTPELSSLLGEVKAQLQTQNISKAISLLENLTTQHPDFEEAWRLYYEVANYYSNWQVALRAISRLVELRPTDATNMIAKIKVLEKAGKVEEFIESAMSLVKSEDLSTAILNELASLLCKYQKYKEAEYIYRQVFAQTPSDSNNLLNLATVLQYQGDIEQADHFVRSSIQQNPTNFDAYFFASHLKRATTSRNNIDELKRTLDEGIADLVSQAKICYSLAKELEDCSQYRESFEFRKRGADTYRSTFNYDIQDDLNFITSIQKNYSKDFLSNTQSINQSNEPIFVVGLPRTGTTLVERIISSHSRARTAGELIYFNQCMDEAFAGLALSQNTSLDGLVGASTNFDFNRLGQRYIELTQLYTRGKPHFVDKFPQNSLYLGLIHSALPKTKSIILERHPLDVCYSVYKQIFTNIYQYSYTLEEVADYFIAHNRLMKHWQTSIPDNVLTIRYENVVNDLTAQVEKILSFLNFDWEEDCLNFQKNKQASATASSSQVRQKLYSTSIGMWKNYEKELSPAIAKLSDAGCLDEWDT
ncbi:MAG: sulfotransferase [Kangiellaceae bacterium]|nr:sulfotransferase [Kangiellaceae bacterium]